MSRAAPKPRTPWIPLPAAKARELSRQKHARTASAPLMELIYDRIQHAAKEGKTSITRPFHGLRLMVNEEDRQAVWSALRTQGYTVTHHPDPDPGHPASSPYDSISWA